MIWLNKEELNGNLAKKSNGRKKTYSLRFRKDERKTETPFITMNISKPFIDLAKESGLTEFAIGVDHKKQEVYLKLVKPDNDLDTISFLNSKGGFRNVVGASAIYNSLWIRTDDNIPLDQKIVFEPSEDDETLFIYQYKL